jgi:hypothetical protein
MRALFLVAVLLAACDSTPGPEVEAPAAESSETHAALSNNAISLTGEVLITPSGLMFERGVTLFTRALEPRSPTDRIGQGGESYGEIAGSLAPEVELRRVTDQVIAPGALNRDGLCGAGLRPGYIALLRDSSALSLIVFAGEQPPGPGATDAPVCAIYAYAPD